MLNVYYLNSIFMSFQLFLLYLSKDSHNSALKDKQTLVMHAEPKYCFYSHLRNISGHHISS